MFQIFKKKGKVKFDTKIGKWGDWQRGRFSVHLF